LSVGKCLRLPSAIDAFDLDNESINSITDTDAKFTLSQANTGHAITPRVISNAISWGAGLSGTEIGFLRFYDSATFCKGLGATTTTNRAYMTTTGVQTTGFEWVTVPSGDPSATATQMGFLSAKDGSFTAKGVITATGSPKFRAKLTNDTTIGAANTFTKLPFDATDFNVGTGFDTTNHKWLPIMPSSNYVHLHACVECNEVAARVGVAIYKNGSILRNAFTIMAGVETVAIDVTDLANGSSDYYEVFVFDGGTNLFFNKTTSDNVTNFEGYVIP